MLLFKTNNPKITAVDISSTANVRHLIPYFYRDRHNLTYTYEKSMNMFHLNKNNFMIETKTLPKILSSVIGNKTKAPSHGDIIEVKFQRRSTLLDPMVSQNGYYGDWIVKPGMTVAIVGIESYNTSSRLYEITAKESIMWELCNGYMMIVDNPSETTVIKFPKMFQKNMNDFDMYEDTLLISCYNEEDTNKTVIDEDDMKLMD